MADTTTSGLAAASALTGTELFPGVQSGSKKVTANQLKTFINPIQNNVTTSDPGVGNDGTQGYAAGSTWRNTATRWSWVCMDASTGAAKWILMDITDHPGYLVNSHYPACQTAIQVGTSVVANTIRFIPLLVKERVTIINLAVRVSTLGTGSCQLAIYASTLVAAGFRPTGNTLSNTGSQSTGVTGAFSVALGANVQLEPGTLYFAAMNSDNATVVFTAIGAGQSNVVWLLGSQTLGNSIANTELTGLSFAQTFGTWPDMTAQTCTEMLDAKAAFINFKVFSIP